MPRRSGQCCLRERDQFIKLFSARRGESSSSVEAARDTNEGNEGVINYPAGTLLHKSQNQWARQRPVCKHTHTQSQHSISLSLSDGFGARETRCGVVRSTQTHTGPKQGLIN
jgi:hypothetical protein